LELCSLFRNLIDGRISAEDLSAAALPTAPGGSYCDGFLTGAAGVAWSGRP
jgi:hypothetical protein